MFRSRGHVEIACSCPHPGYTRRAGKRGLPGGWYVGHGSTFFYRTGNEAVSGHPVRSLNGRGLGRCGKAVPEDTDLEDRIERLIGGTVESAGFRLVRVKMFTRSKRVLQIMIEREDGEAATVDDCAMVSRLVGLHLDDGDPISGAYDLEVSSTGIDRPLVRRAAAFPGQTRRTERWRRVHGADQGRRCRSAVRAHRGRQARSQR